MWDEELDAEGASEARAQVRGLCLSGSGVIDGEGQAEGEGGRDGEEDGIEKGQEEGEIVALWIDSIAP